MNDEEGKQFNVYLPLSLIRRGKFRAIEAQQSADALRAYLAAPQSGRPPAEEE
ncbi:hypothetical protein P4G95_20270 [Burkholderia vietnamiensis]|jgi:hypothetical protein|uniref:hypothetical protein n=1 Tax=Burkholderia vietnamiensis TaxID=60552 RepID=UPI000A47E9F8|nr:hypothetical protein [Burkholderia vietnamiensis]MBR8281603.1 hypothetical protein [Burkholderia vietnamiensis]MCA8194382.1 hypothetical protein [Burkholderia vietnamiensis]WHU93726.1 hypothetical protein P4G95_20270 [Burkholderia vietnamiensis]